MNRTALLSALTFLFFLLSMPLMAQSEDDITELQKAVRAHNLAKVKQLVSDGADLETENRWGRTALDIAIETDQLETVRYLLSKGAKGRSGVQAAAENNNLAMVRLLIEHDFTLGYALVYAAENNNMEMVKVLVNAGSEINLSQKRKSGLFKKYYVSPIEMAVDNNNIQMVGYLLDHGASLSEAIEVAFSGSKESIIRALIDRSGDYASFLKPAFERGNRNIIDYLASKGADMHVNDEEGNSLLHTVCAAGNYDLALYCVEQQKLSVNAVNHKNETPLMFAVGANNIQLVSWLIQQGADVNAKNNLRENALFYVGPESGLDMFELLTGNGADISLKSMNNTTLLINSAKNKSFEITRFLLENGADVNATDDTGHTAFQYVISPWERNDVLTKLFLERGADINTRDAADGKSMMYYAIASERIARVKELHAMGASVDVLDNRGKRPRIDDKEIIMYLVENGANINATDSRDDSYLCVAIDENDLELAHFLVDKGIDVNQNCYFTEPALVRAIEDDNLVLVQFLVDNGADVNAVGYFNKSMIQYARDKGNQEIINYLEGQGAMTKEDRNELFRRSMEMERNMRSAMNSGNEEQLAVYLKSCDGLVIQKRVVEEVAVFAAEEGNPVLVELLLTKMGLDINEQINSSNQNMLMIATIHDETSLVSFLIHKGCNLQMYDAQGKQAHEYASGKAMKKIYKDSGL